MNSVDPIALDGGRLLAFYRAWPGRNVLAPAAASSQPTEAALGKARGVHIESGIGNQILESARTLEGIK